ncbi:FeoA domain-containing protein [Psychrobacter sp. SCQQ22]|uniref:FeoA family protein n=1 Tax=Psychrobacter sp. SCQQ22 TaxID=2792059 RepID=UPI0018CCD361|nr:FeoA domain-containing protein [Psychrobacter sp. SCQQ22]MBH0086216.1 FeoA domain-containing protein [Psychrobacter sp. SCQQ22]
MSITILPSQRPTTDTSTFSDNKTTSSPVCSLLNFDKRQPAIIDEIVANSRFGEIDGAISQRLKDLGFLPNTLIHIVAKGLFGKPPYAVQLSTGAQFSLRADELIKIQCRAVT